jgi:hypothetical protein
MNGTNRNDTSFVRIPFSMGLMHSSTTVLPNEGILHEIVITGINVTVHIGKIYFGPVDGRGLRMGIE